MREKEKEREIHMKLLSINTHSLIEENYEKKVKIFVEAVARIKPDIICMQEVNQTNTAALADDSLKVNQYIIPNATVPLKADNHAALVAKLLREAGVTYYWVWSAAKMGYDKYDEGQAIFSLKPIEEIHDFPISKVDDFSKWKTRHVLGARVQGLPDWYYSVHMGWWTDEEEPFQTQWDKLETELYLRKIDTKVWLLGDFNSPSVVRNQGYDYIRSKGWHDTYENVKIKDTGITVAGIIDGWRGLIEGNPDQLKGMRIDYVWCNKEDKMLSSLVIFNGENEEVISDHFGVLVEY